MLDDLTAIIVCLDRPYAVCLKNTSLQAQHLRNAL